MRRITRLIPLLILIISCASEKIAISPVSEALAGNGIDISRRVYSSSSLEKKTEIDYYLSEIGAAISAFPIFENELLNKEISILKYTLKEYIYATQEFNVIGQDNAFHKFEKSYVKVQKLKKNLSINDDEIVNRYLVRIKSNIQKLEALRKSNVR